MTAKDRLVYAIIKFLADETAGPIEEEAKESIEVAKQCLETAYKLEHNTKPELDLGADLLEIVESIPPPRGQKEITPERKQQAEQLKTDGNDCMKTERFEEAVEAYTKAIDIDNTNAIYYSNRAAAYNKMSRFYEAVEDCDEAMAIDPNYSKAYGRKGLALSGLNRHAEAIENYKKAIELDPSNANFQTNLEIAEEKARSTSGAAPGLGVSGFGSLLGGGGGGGGMPDMSSLLNNPAMMGMAAQMMQNPAMQQMMNNMMGGMQPQGQPEPTAPNSAPTDPPGGMENILRAGQQIAEQMQMSNPDLVNQLRNQFQGSMGGDNPPPSNDSN